MTARTYDRPITRGTRVVYPALSRQVAIVTGIVRMQNGNYSLQLTYVPPLSWKDGTTQAHADALAASVVIVERGVR